MLDMKNWLQNNVSKIKDALFKTRGRDLPWQVSTGETYIEINDNFYDDLLEKLIKADVGNNLSEQIISNLKKQIQNQKIKEPNLKIRLKEVIKDIVRVGLKPTPTEQNVDFTLDKLNIALITGVNGSGKTTSIGKLAKYFKESGFKVLIVAADTFRAAAQEQLTIWANRSGVEIYSPVEIKKPDAVVFSAMEKAKKENYNLILVDTAGRLHSQINLMDELKKIDLVIVKAIHAALGEPRLRRELPQHYEKLIVLDATIGQNAMNQAEFFSKAIGLTGIILAKLDSSAKGGVILNIINKLSLPVKLIGTGEKIDDLAEFDMDTYLDGLVM